MQIKSLSRRSTGKKSLAQQGFTLIELLIVVAVIAVLAIGANAGLNLRNDQVGSNEGKVINYALTCIQSKNSSVSYGSVTIASMANLGCFQDEAVTGKGTAAASAVSNLVGSAYTIAPVNLSGTNDGVGITVAAVPAKNCAGLVKAAAQSSTRVTVTPTAGTAVIVKPVGGTLDDIGLGLACGSAVTASVQAVIGKS